MSRNNTTRLLILGHALLLLAINMQFQNHWGRLYFRLIAHTSIGFVFVAQAALLAIWAALSNQPLPVRSLGLALLPILAMTGSHLMLGDYQRQCTGWWSISPLPNAARQMAWTAHLGEPALMIFGILTCLRVAGMSLSPQTSPELFNFPRRRFVSWQTAGLWIISLCAWGALGWWLHNHYWSWSKLALHFTEGMRVPPVEFALIAVACVWLLARGPVWYRLVVLVALAFIASVLDTYFFKRWESLWFIMDDPASLRVSLRFVFWVHLAFFGVMAGSILGCRLAGFRLVYRRPRWVGIRPAPESLEQESGASLGDSSA